MSEPEPTPQNPYLPRPAADPEPQAGPPTQPLHPFPAAPGAPVAGVPPYGAPVPYGAPTHYGAPTPYGAPGPYAAAPTPWGHGVPWSPPPDHPQATTALVLGVIAVMGFPLTGPFAWYIGGRARRAIDTDPSRWGGRGLATAGYALGIVTTSLMALFVGFIVLVVALAAGG